MSNETLAQWEDRRREHFGSVVTLLLGVASASLAYCGSLLSSDDTQFGGARTAFFLLASACFAVSLFSGLFVAFSRLQDARATVRIVRAREQGPTQEYLERLRSTAHKWGQKTWLGLYLQLASFAVGVVFLVVTISLMNSDRLFPKKNEPNKAMETTPVDVTIPAAQEVAPSTSVSHL